MGQEQSKPQAVIELKGNKPAYNVEAVKAMMESGPVGEDTKVFVICISGVYRSGKSFLLNLLKTYMDYYDKHRSDAGWIGSTNIKIKGGNWAQGEDTVTHGIWMYMHPNLINGKAIILMDCQGNKDVMKSTPTLDNLILFLGLQLADVHILNVNGTVGADDFDRLGLWAYHAEDGSGDSLFEKQIFLVRNWGNCEKPKQLDQVINGTASESVKAAALGIKKAFKTVETEALPYPGRGVDGKSEGGNITLRDVDHAFLIEARELFHRLILKLPSQARMNGEEFFNLFKFVSMRAVGKISTPQEAYEESLIKVVFKESSAHFKAEVEKLEARGSQLTAQQMESQIDAVYREVVGKFNSNQRVRNCQNPHITRDYLDYLEKAYKETIVLMKHKFELEMLTSQVAAMKKNEETAKNKLRSSEDECRRAREQLDRLKTAETNANILRDMSVKSEALKAACAREQLKSLKTAETNANILRDMSVKSEALKAAEKVIDEKEAIRREYQEAYETVKAERDAILRERERKVEAAEERMRNPGLGEATVVFGKSLFNNTLGRLFRMKL